MEQILQITALCVVGSLLALTIRRGSPESALLLALAAAVLVLLVLLESLGELTSFFMQLAEHSGLPSELFVPLYKILGIALVVRIGSGLCQDAGERALASVVETAGAICALLTALPLLRAVLSMLLELMKS